MGCSEFSHSPYRAVVRTSLTRGVVMRIARATRSRAVMLTSLRFLRIKGSTGTRRVGSGACGNRDILHCERTELGRFIIAHFDEHESLNHCRILTEAG